MVNQLFRSTSQGSGIALAAMVVGALSLHAPGTAANAQTDARRVAKGSHGISQTTPVRTGLTAGLTKVDFDPNMYHSWPKI